MTNLEITITCTATDEIVYTGPKWGATDALVLYYCDNSTPQEIYDACCDLGDLIATGDDTSELCAYLACEVTYEVTDC